MNQESSHELNRLHNALGSGASVQFVLFGSLEKSGVVFGTIPLDP